jgi:hypothetical protein
MFVTSTRATNMNASFSFGSALNDDDANTHKDRKKTGAARNLAQHWSSMCVFAGLSLALEPDRGRCMRVAGKASVAGLSLSLVAGTGWAAEICARAPDLVALQVSALQQQLMVAALTCNDVSLYNSFVITYQSDLVASDQALQAFFDRFGDAEGTPAYHSFKTKMANLYSARSATDKNRFCANARTSFGPALKAEKLSLSSFAMSVPSTVNEPYTNCGESVAGSAMVARTPVVAPTPLPSNLLTAQNAAAAAKGATAAPAATSDAADKPLGVGLRAAPPATAAEPAAVAAATTPNAAAPSTNQAANTNSNPGRGTRYAQGRYASEAYRERLAQQRAAQRPRLSYRDRYEARGYFWPADPYWEYCYTRYGVRMTCAEAAQRFRSNQFYYRAPYDDRGYSPTR